MTTQLGLLAATLHHTQVGCRFDSGRRICSTDPYEMPHGPDAAYLIDHCVRVVDTLGLSYALGSMRPAWSQHRTYESAAAAILDAFDRQGADASDSENDR